MNKCLKFLSLSFACLYPSIAFANYHLSTSDVILIMLIEGLIYIGPILFVIILTIMIVKKKKQKDVAIQSKKLHGKFDKSKLSTTLYSVSEIKLRLEPVFLKHNVKSAFLLGDYTKESPYDDNEIKIYNKDSEIEILIETDPDRSKNIIDDSDYTLLSLLNDIMNALEKNVSILDARGIDEDSIRKFQTTGIQIYGQV